jgi:hypothetical protein
VALSIGDDGDVKNFKAEYPEEDDKPRTPTNDRELVLNDKAKLDILWRPFADGWIVTVTLFNSKIIEEEVDAGQAAEIRNVNSLFEVELKCTLDKGEVGTYPKADQSLLTQEEQELALRKTKGSALHS